MCRRRELSRLRAIGAIIGLQGFTPLCSVAGRLVRVAKLRRAARSYLLSYGYSAFLLSIAHVLDWKDGRVFLGQISSPEARCLLRLLPIGGIVCTLSVLVPTMTIGEARDIGRSAISTLAKLLSFSRQDRRFA